MPIRNIKVKLFREQDNSKCIDLDRDKQEQT